jgi:hypothetical protein
VFIDHVAEYQPGGLDQCQARLYTAILRHVVLVMAALAVCAVTAAQFRDRTDAQAPPPAGPGDRPPADPGLIPLVPPTRTPRTQLCPGQLAIGCCRTRS